jgi:hypothetical protein
VAWVAGAVILLGLAGFYFYRGYAPGGGSGCIKMLPLPYCLNGQEISYVDRLALGFEVPAGTEIKAPFDGIYVQLLPEGYMEGDPLGKFMVSTADENSSVFVAGLHTPAVASWANVKKGDVIARMLEDTLPLHAESGSNLVIYTENYDTANLFR